MTGALTWNSENGDGLERLWIIMLGLSILVHALVIALATFLPQLSGMRPKEVPVINVDLVGMAGPAPVRSAPAPKAPAKVKEAVPVKKPAPKLAAKPEVVPPPVKEPEKVPTKDVPKPKVKKSLKKKTIDTQKMVDKALASLQKDVETDRPRSVRDAIEAMKQKSREQAQNAEVEDMLQDSGPAGPGVATLGALGQFTENVLSLYSLEVEQHVKSNWVCPQSLVGTGIKAKISFTIKKSGMVEKSTIWPVERSGNGLFDLSMERAVLKSNPLPPIPPELQKNEQPFVVEFIAPAS